MDDFSHGTGCSMLKIRTIMNSPVEEIFAFKCCYGVLTFDPNLEIHLENAGDRTLVVPSFMDMEGSYGTRRIDNLMPAGELTIEPFEIQAFYCRMEEHVWSETRELVFRDTEGREYRATVGETSLSQS
jgi:hypothetical protein